MTTQTDLTYNILLAISHTFMPDEPIFNTPNDAWIRTITDNTIAASFNCVALLMGPVSSHILYWGTENNSSAVKLSRWPYWKWLSLNTTLSIFIWFRSDRDAFTKHVYRLQRTVYARGQHVLFNILCISQMFWHWVGQP